MKFSELAERFDKFNCNIGDLSEWMSICNRPEILCSYFPNEPFRIFIDTFAEIENKTDDELIEIIEDKFVEELKNRLSDKIIKKLQK